MGSQQSSADDAAGTTANGACYYALLGIDPHATDNDIKKAYRSRALELHPDRNLQDVETATRRFAEIQAAYDVLSDPHERAWYDSHRESIYNGQGNYTDDADPAGFRNVHVITTEEILDVVRKFNAPVTLNDQYTIFFSTVKATFDRLAREEEAVAGFDNAIHQNYPEFGSEDDDFHGVVKPFYAAWNKFSTRKSFAWMDKHRLSEAPDRRVRRLMEKENKKSREHAIHDFNDAVKAFVGFVKKRDLRYLTNIQNDAERQESLRGAATAQAARSRAANQQNMASYRVPEWAKSEDNDAQERNFPESDEDEESEIEIIECVVCNKTFKSVNQLDSHERSKKHIKALRDLRRDLEKSEGAELDLDAAFLSALDLGQDPGLASPPSATSARGNEVETADRTTDVSITPEQTIANRQKPTSSLNSDDHAPRLEVDKTTNVSQSPDSQNIAELPVQIGEKSTLNPTARAKAGKAKATREKRKTTDAQMGHCCSVCAEPFPSKNQLFKHIRHENHAAPVPKPPLAAGNAKGKKLKHPASSSAAHSK